MSLDTYISERHLGEKYQTMVDEKIGKFSSKFDTTFESWFQDGARSFPQMVDNWQDDSATYLA